MISKLALGTAQFGMDYGIKNVRGKIPREEVSKILTTAYSHKITTIDTAYNYGDAEKIIGEVIGEKSINFNIISKFPACDEDEGLKIFRESISNLRVTKLYGYLIHDIQHFLKHPKIWEIMLKLKKQGRVEHIGFSLYNPNELEELFSGQFEFDIIQVPYNIFDQRFANLFKQFRERNIIVYIRSVFLQGLLLMNPITLPEFFASVRRKIVALRALSKEQKIPLFAICLQFAVLNPYVDKVIIGIDSEENLMQNINSSQFENQIKKIYRDLLNFRENNKEIILPTLWPKQL